MAQVKCMHCDGGKVDCRKCAGKSPRWWFCRCEACGSSGKVKCTRCDGTGSTQTRLGFAPRVARKVCIGLAWFRTNVFKCAVVTHVLALILAILVAGGSVRLYGETCGLNPFRPSTYLGGATRIGSSWCSSLNWAQTKATSVVKNLMYHLFGLMVNVSVACVTRYVPGLLNEQAGTQAGTTSEEANVDTQEQTTYTCGHIQN